MTVVTLPNRLDVASIRALQAHYGHAEADSTGASVSPLAGSADLSDLLIDLNAVTWIELDGLVALAALLPSIGSADSRVVIRPPSRTTREPKSSNPAQFLSNARFGSFLAQLQTRLGCNVSLSESLPPPWYGASSRVLPLSLISVRDFDHKGGWHEADPRLTGVFLADLSKSFAEIATHFSPDHMQALQLWIREAGWNAVVHSSMADGAGWAVLGLQHRPDHKPPVLDFALADIGRGVPASLGDSFDTFLNRLRAEGRNKDLSQWTSYVRDEGVLRFALTDFGTRRSDRSGQHRRGLGKMIDVMHERSKLTLASQRIELATSSSGTANNAISTYQLDDAWHGTLVSGRIAEPQNRPIGSATSRSSKWLSAMHLVHLVDAAGTYRLSEAMQNVQEFLAAFTAQTGPQTYKTLILDCGFSGQLHERDLQTMLGVVQEVPLLRVCVWNCPLAPELLGEMNRALAVDPRQLPVPPIFVCRNWAAWAVGVTKTQHSRITDLEDWFGATVDRDDHGNDPNPALTRVTLQNADLTTLDVRCNSAFLAEGFASGSATNGFYKGNISLLDGGHATRFLAMQHLLQHPAQSHRDRFVNSLLCRIAASLSSSKAPGQPVIVGFAGSAYELIRGVASALGWPAVVIHPYDVPQSEELRSHIGKETSVVLITDVISSGSLMTSMVEAIERIGAKVVLRLAAVQSQSDENSPVSNVDVTSRFTRRPVEDASPEGDPLEIDPITFVPRPIADDQGARDRIDQSLALIERTTSVTFGHQKVTERHSSAVVDVEQLVKEGRDELRSLLKAELDDLATNVVSFGDFFPTLAVVPDVGTRLELLSEGDTAAALAHSHRRATAALLDLVSAVIAPATLTEIRVARQYDHAGRPEVSFNPRQRQALNGNDILIIDDGIASGATLGQILRRAVETGARRVWAITICCRAPLREADFWDSVTSLRVGSNSVPVRVTIPVYLPIPFHSAKSCPVEQAMGHLRPLLDIPDAIGAVAKTILEDREVGDWETFRGRWGQAYASTRLRCHAYAELAERFKWARVACESLLSDVVARLTEEADLPPEVAERARAVLDVFVDEPDLLDRPRMRKNASPIVRKTARLIARNPLAPIDLRRTALVVLRSGPRKHFLEALESGLPEDVSDSSLLLERLAFQTYTLGVRGQLSAQAVRAGHRLLELADQLRRASVEDDSISRAWDIAFTSTMTPIAHETSGDLLTDIREAESEVQIRQREHHEVPNALAHLMGGDGGLRLKPSLFEGSEPAVRQLLNLMRERFFPLLASLTKQLQSAPGVTPMDTGQIAEEYLASAIDPRGGMLQADVKLLVFACTRGHPPVQSLLPEIHNAAKRLRTAFFAGRDSSVLRVLSSWKSTTANDLADVLRAQIEHVVGQIPGIRIELRKLEGASPTVLGPPELYRLVFASWADNLLKAFPMDFPDPTVVVIVEHRDVEDENRPLTITIVDNGEGLVGESTERLSSTTIGLRESCASFGGRLTPAANNPSERGCVAKLELRTVSA